MATDIKEYDLPFKGTTIHCYEGGQGYPIVLVHGSGPGTASASNWGRVLTPLSDRYHVLAMDLVGYGLSGRKQEEPYFDMNYWAQQVQFVLNHFSPRGPIGLIGHSLGGAIAIRGALLEPRVDKLLLQGSLGAHIKLNTAIDVSWDVPKDEAAFRHFYKTVIRVKGELSDDFIRDRLAIVRKDGYDRYFAKMYAGDKQKYLDQAELPKERLAALGCEVLMIHGEADTCVPFEEGALPLAEAIPHADLIRLAHCGHPCSFDAPEKFLKFAKAFFG
jgi:2-hydroxymuconate-semialdehyde hydrolase